MKLGRGRSWMYVAVGIVIAGTLCSPANAALFGLWKRSKAKEPQVAHKQSLVVFPFDQTEVTRVPSTFGEYIAGDLRDMISDSDRYSVLVFRDKLAPIVRARSENSLRPEDVIPPFGEDKSKALKLTQILAGDLLVIGSVDDYQVDRATKTAMMTLSAQLFDGKSGKLLKVLTVTGRTPESLQNAEEEELRDLAKGDAVNKLGAEIAGAKKPADVEPTPAVGEGQPAKEGDNPETLPATSGVASPSASERPAK